VTGPTEGIGAGALVVTTIGHPTAAMRALARGALDRGLEFIVIGDEKSPAHYDLEGATFYDLDAQRGTGMAFASRCPTRHYARKNIGYLLAMQKGVDIIVETDDDNLPLPGFWDRRDRHVRAAAVAQAGWVNVYRHFSDADAPIWPRGLPLNAVSNALPDLVVGDRMIDCPIQQGLVNEDPDVDAVYRLIERLPFTFDQRPPIALGKGSWSPFNSQNTTWFADAFPLLYLPFHCSFRVTDIWRSFVAQRIAWENGWSILFHQATVWQERNEHDLMADFEDEIPGYLHNRRIGEALAALPVPSGTGRIGDALLMCYEELIRLGVVGREEFDLVESWVSDCEAIGG